MARAIQRQSPDKVERRANAKSKRHINGLGENAVAASRAKVYSEQMKPITPLNERQRVLMSVIPSKDLTFVTGPAGTGKTTVPIGVALQKLFARQIDRIVLTKADFSIDGKWAPVPGDEDDKFKHLFRPMRENFYKFIQPGHLENLEHTGKVKFEVLANVLGLTYDDAYVLIDEAQCTTVNQMKALLTRMGQRSRYIVAGDHLDQNYLDGRNGLEDALSRFGRHDRVGRVNFEIEDVVRHEFVKDVILGYRMKPSEIAQREAVAQTLEEDENVPELADFLRYPAYSR